MHELRAKARMILCARRDLNLHILRMLEGTFSLDTVHLFSAARFDFSVPNVVLFEKRLKGNSDSNWGD